jgi:hypothetical protein
MDTPGPLNGTSTSNPYMPLVNCQKKFRFFSFDFRQNFEVRTFSR